MMILELKNVVKHYEVPSREKPVEVLKGISLQIKQGDALAIIGPSGSGKSTLLNIMGSLDKPTSGFINFAGSDLATLDDSELARMRNRDIGFVFQLHHLLPQCTILENVLIPTIPLKSDKENGDVRNRAMTLLKRVGLDQYGFHFPPQISAGEQQRVAVVRALINSPKLVLADEPTGSLDQTSSEQLGQLLIELNKEEGVTLIVVTHSMDLARRMEKTYHLREGILVDTD